MIASKRLSPDNMILLIDWENKKKITKGLAQGTYYYTFYQSGTFAGWRTKKEIVENYPKEV